MLRQEFHKHNRKAATSRKSVITWYARKRTKRTGEGLRLRRHVANRCWVTNSVVRLWGREND